MSFNALSNTRISYHSSFRVQNITVVALFNAIAKAKRDTVAAEEASSSSKKERAEAARDDTENTSVVSRERALQASKMAASSKKGKVAESAEAEKGSKWAALRDDYMIGEQLTVKVSLCVDLCCMVLSRDKVFCQQPTLRLTFAIYIIFVSIFLSRFRIGTRPRSQTASKWLLVHFK